MTDLSKYDKPQELAFLDAICPTDVLGVLMPHLDEIPDEFRDRHFNPYCVFASTWFYKGVDAFELRSDINHKQAMQHLGACLRSFGSSHEAKISGVGYLLKCWGLVLTDDGEPDVKKTKHNKTGKKKGKKKGKKHASNR